MSSNSISNMAVQVPTMGTHGAIGYVGTLGLQAGAAHVAFDSALWPMASTVLALNPLYVAGVCVLFIVVDTVAKEILKTMMGTTAKPSCQPHQHEQSAHQLRIVGLHANDISWIASRMMLTVFVTSTVAATLGLVPTIVTAAILIGLTLVVHNKWVDITHNHNYQRYSQLVVENCHGDTKNRVFN